MKGFIVVLASFPYTAVCLWCQDLLAWKTATFMQTDLDEFLDVSELRGNVGWLLSSRVTAGVRILATRPTSHS